MHQPSLKLVDGVQKLSDVPRNRMTVVSNRLRAQPLTAARLQPHFRLGRQDGACCTRLVAILGMLLKIRPGMTFSHGGGNFSLIDNLQGDDPTV